eukprot:Skav216218  [mRNA]  locus=scaffold238:327181:331866:- [translate_table: standard]
MSTEFLHGLDSWLVHDDVMAFKKGLRLDLEVISFTNQGVVAKPCNHEVSTSEFECIMPTWCLQYIDVGRTFTILDFKMVGNSHVLEGKGAKLFPILHPIDSAKGVAEAFGGLGGWTLGAKLNGTHVSLIVEADPNVAEAASRSLGIPCYSVDVMMDMALNMSLPDEAIVISDVLDPKIWVLAGLMNIACWLSSPPCPPWSGASRVRGLFATEGQTLVKFIYLLGISKCRCVNMENVPGLPKHIHYALVKVALYEAGLEIAVSSVDRLTPLLPATRPRWLATFVRSGMQFPANVVQRVRSLGIPSRLSDSSGDSIQASDVVQWTLQDWELCQCTPDQFALSMMGRSDLLPLKMRKDGYHLLTPEQILKLRVKSTRQILPNIMAMQGVQHELPLDLLQERGLHSFIVQVGENARFSTPFEILGALGFPPQMCLPDEFRVAWHMTGNTLSVAHAALQCLRARWLLGKSSGIGENLNGAFDICAAVRGQMIRMSSLKTVQDNGWMQLVPLDHAGNDDVLHSDAESVVSVATTIPDQREAISPTMQFHVHEPTCAKRKCEDHHHDEISKRTCQHAPQDNQVDPVLIPQVLAEEFPNLQGLRVSTMQPIQGECCFQAFPEVKGYELVVNMIHSQGIWSAIVVMHSRATVLHVLRINLPHAVEQHFHEVRINGVVVGLEEVHAAPSPWDLCFRPHSFGRIILAPFLQQTLVVEVDLTWTVADLKAYVAAEAAILPTQLSLKNDDQVCADGCFVLSFQGVMFKAEILRSLAPPDWMNMKPEMIENTQMKNACPEIGDDAPDDQVRVTYFDVKWQVVRSQIFDANILAVTLLENLFPNPCVKPELVLEGIRVEDNTPLSEFPLERYEIHFQELHKLDTVMVVSKVTEDRQDDKIHDAVQLWVRSPFKDRATCGQFRPKWSLCELTVSFLVCSKGEHSVQILQSGKLLSGMTRVRDVDHTRPLELRLCQLKGGAKNNAVAKKLREMLLSRGVNSDNVAERVATIQSKISGSDLTKIFALEEKEIWTALKTKANQSQVRLVTSEELKTHQKAIRQMKPDNASGSSDFKMPRKKNKMDDRPKTISINPMHFSTSDGDQVPMISTGQWGPDMKGFTIVSKEEAEKHMPPKKLSADPLALVVLTNVPFHGLVPVTVPASDHEGRPTLANAVVVNFGDKDICCRPSLPKVDLEAVPTAIVEVTIQKAQAVDWDKVRNPLDYLGQQVPELRKNQVISSWSWKTFDADRSPCAHERGHYAHGYMRVTEAVLIPTLARSGQAGVYLQPKTSDKKPDQRFGVVTLHGLSHEEVTKHAQSCKDALGVVQVGRDGSYAVRARREHITAIRQQISPNSICVQQGSVPTGATWWILRNIHVSTTCGELTAALKKLGWEASAIKPSGKASWVVCSIDSPPATHLCIGQDYVAVLPLLKQHGKTANSHEVVVPAPVIPDCSMCPDDDAASSTTASRLSDMKNELEDKLMGMINEKIRGCDERISGVANSVAEVKNDLHTVAEHTQKSFNEVKNQQNSIQMQIEQNNNGLMKQMQSLFTQMQQDLKSSFAGGEGERKCQKTDHDKDL